MLRYAKLLSAAIFLALFVTVGVAGATTRTFRLTLRGLDAVPRGDPGDSASAAITINSGNHMVCWTFARLKGIGDSTHPKIGNAPKGKRGPIVLLLGKRFKWKGCVIAAARTLTAIRRQPTSYYIVLTNQVHPDGAVRAQF